MSISRRSMVGGLSALAGATTLKLSGSSLDLTEDFELPKELTVLFQGDSITDAGRDKAKYYFNNPAGMGNGYVRQLATELLGTNPGTALKIYNRGISGHKVFQLRDRWEDDCMVLQPDVLSVMIGVNDFWHTLDWDYKGTVEVYESDFMKLMERTKKELPDVKLIVGEPFVLHEGTAIKTDKWKGVFEGYQAAAKRVSDQFGGTFVPYQQVFDEALKTAPTSYWCPDGVHPSMAGNYLMAQAWLKAFKIAMK